MKRQLLAILIGLFLAIVAFGQREYTPLTYRCPSVPSSTAKLQFTRNGDVNVIPCPSKNLLLNGLPIAGTFASLNGLTTNTQIFASPGAADTAIWSSVGSTHTLNLPIQSITG